MPLTSRRTLLSSILGVALVMAVAAPSHAQYLGKPTGPPTWPTAQQRQRESVVTQKDLRRVDSMLEDVAATMRQVSATPTALEQHGEMIAGMHETLEQLRTVHRHLETMLTDPALLSDRKIALSFSRVHRQLEAMTSALQSMARYTQRAVNDSAHGTTN